MSQIQHYFEEQAAEWDRRMPPDRVVRLSGLLAPYRDHFIGTILDVGAGTGVLAETLRSIGVDCAIVSVDFAFHMLREAQKRNVSAHHIQADVYHLPFRAGRFHTAIVHAAFPHFIEHAAALGELWRVIRPCGSLLIVHEIGRERVNAIHASSPLLVDHQLPPGDVLQGWLRDAGFGDALVDDAADHYLAIARKPRLPDAE